MAVVVAGKSRIDTTLNGHAFDIAIRRDSPKWKAITPEIDPAASRRFFAAAFRHAHKKTHNYSGIAKELFTGGSEKRAAAEAAAKKGRYDEARFHYLDAATSFEQLSMIMVSDEKAHEYKGIADFCKALSVKFDNLQSIRENTISSWTYQGVEIIMVKSDQHLGTPLKFSESGKAHKTLSIVSQFQRALHLNSMDSQSSVTFQIYNDGISASKMGRAAIAALKRYLAGGHNGIHQVYLYVPQQESQKPVAAEVESSLAEAEPSIQRSLLARAWQLLRNPFKPF